MVKNIITVAIAAGVTYVALKQYNKRKASKVAATKSVATSSKPSIAEVEAGIEELGEEGIAIEAQNQQLGANVRQESMSGASGGNWDSDTVSTGL